MIGAVELSVAVLLNTSNALDTSVDDDVSRQPAVAGEYKGWSKEFSPMIH